MSFGEILRQIRKQNGSLRAVAEMLDTDFAYLSRLENDKVSFTPSSEFLHRIIEKLEHTEEQREALFAEAKRLDTETEHAVDESHHRPALRALFKSAPKLSEAELKELNLKIEELLNRS